MPRPSSDTERQDEAAMAKSLSLSRRRTPVVSVPGLTILRCLGEGAYGSVWQAREKNTGKLVAVKVYSHRGGLDWSLLSREVEKLAILYTSRNIVGLLEVGWDSDPPYYVMEYLERGSLAGLLTDGPLPVREAIRIAKGILQALVHAHGSGILHCDLKPANVLLDADLEPRLCDFGQSRLSYEQAPALGTLFYMAPEQADLKAVPDARWDVYALGAVLYHLICGTAPHRTSENEARIEAAATLEERLATYGQLVRDGANPSLHLRVRGVDRRLTEIVDHCLEPDPDKRFANAQAVVDALEQRERARSFWPLLALGGLGPVLLMLALGLFYLDSMRDAVDSAARNVTTRALESDVLTVEILARSVARELEKRTAELESLADDPELESAIKAAADRNWSDRSELGLLLVQEKSRTDQLQRQLGLNRDRSWFLTDARGFQRWREPQEESTLDENWSHRDYFHGMGEFERNTVPAGMQPITKPHLSLSYKSQATGQNVASLTVPVWDKKHERVIGVLGRSMQLGQLLSPYVPGNRHEAEAEDAGDRTRKIVLIDDRNWQLLDHPWMSEERRDGVTNEEVRQLRLSAEVIARLRPTPSVGEPTEVPVVIQMRDYIDPVGQFNPDDYGGEWLAAFCRVGDTGWFAIVQERKSAVLRPVDALAARLRRDGAWALVVSGVLIGTLWLVVLRGLKERSERPLSPAARASAVTFD
ncbi:MAG: serine/threonine-protein kinase [Planctomycetaceae bacterium]